MSIQISQKKRVAILMMLSVVAATSGFAQEVQRVRPVWWFGESGAANINSYRGTTQMLNSTLTVPTAFHKGSGVKPYASVLAEYRPNKFLGGMLNIGFDNRGGKFKGVMAPCNCPADLSTNISYLTIEPSLRLAPFSSAFYVFAGPTVNINISKKFEYSQDKQQDVRGDWSDIKKTGISAQAGAGIDIPISARNNTTQMTISPFVSFLTDIGHEPRKVESWAFYTIRAGVALKLGAGKKTPPPPVTPVSPVTSLDKQVQFSVVGPKVFASAGQVKETFPLRNTVFYDKGSSEIPVRYIALDNVSAGSFHEEQLQLDQPENLQVGRSARQLKVYHNILNIIGDRMRANPDSRITVTSSMDVNAAEGKAFAENVKQYLVNVFGIDASRIITQSKKRTITAQQPRTSSDVIFLAEGGRSVDIESASPELLLQVGGTSMAMLKPVQISAKPETYLDRRVIFNNTGANQLLESYTVQVTDEQGGTKTFGPYSKDQESVSPGEILGDKIRGNYIVRMVGKTKSGENVSQESRVSLVKASDRLQQGLRYSILFDFDQSKSIDTYEQFLSEMVTPLIPDSSMVIIHGYTDVIGDSKYNLSLSNERALGVQQIIEKSLAKTNRKGVDFETHGFGSNAGMSPFDNNLPEERFYNRTVIIDILSK